MRKTFAAAALIFVATQSAMAGFYDGNKMHQSCKESQLFVLGYVSGAYDASEAGQAAAFAIYLAGLGSDFKPANSKAEQAYTNSAASLGTYCVPKGVILQQVTDIFCQYLANNPSERQEPANFLLARALSKAWPCRPFK